MDGNLGLDGDFIDEDYDQNEVPLEEDFEKMMEKEMAEENS